MRRLVAASAGLCISLACSASFAAEPQPSDPLPTRRDSASEAADASCQYARAVADSQSAVLVSPRLFVTGGFVTGADSPTGGTTTTTQPRVIAGAQYSFSGLYQGLQTTQLAEAECTRLRVFNKMFAFSLAHAGAETTNALQAKLTVLEEADAHANEILKAGRDGVRDGRITVDEYDVTVSRVDALRAATADTRSKLRIEAGSIAPPSESLSELEAQRDRAERATEARAARIRKSQAWDVTVRGGYDQIIGQHQPVPLFGALTVSFSPGYFWQGSADDRAEAARALAARKNLQGGSVRAEETARVLQERARADRERLSEVSSLLAELEAQHQHIAQIQGDRAHAAADALWLGMVTLRAEHAYVRTHLADVTQILGNANAPAPRR